MEEENFSTADRITYDDVAQNMGLVEEEKFNQGAASDYNLSYEYEVLNGDNYDYFCGFVSNNTFIRIDAVNCEDINLDDIVSNPNLSTQENERIKSIIVNTILYLYDFEVNFDNILSAIDEDASEYWLATMRPHWVSQDERWNIIDEITHERDFNREFSRLLRGFYSTFMMYSEICEHNRFLDIIVTFYQICGFSGQESGYLRYYFTFEKIDSVYKLIGLAAGT